MTRDKTISSVCEDIGIIDKKAQARLTEVTRSFFTERDVELHEVREEELKQMAREFLATDDGRKHVLRRARERSSWSNDELHPVIEEHMFELMKIQKKYRIDTMRRKRCKIDFLDTDAEDGAETSSFTEGSPDEFDPQQFLMAEQNPTPVSPDNRALLLTSPPPADTSHLRSSNRAETSLITNSTPQQMYLTPGASSFGSGANLGTTKQSQGVIAWPPAPAGLGQGVAANALAPLSAKTAPWERTTTTQSLSMHYLGKTWIFGSIEEKAKVLEKILLQEEADVKQYQMLAERPVVTTAGPEEVSRIQNDFRYCLRFTSETFPKNKTILLENGVLLAD